MQLFGFNPAEGRLIINLAKMNIRDRYLGSKLGLVWAVMNPLFLLGVYTYVFGFVFRAKVPGADTTFAFAIWLISGYVPYMAFSDALNATAGSVISGASLVKNVVFKSETLPYAAALTAVVPFMVGMIFLLILLFIDGNYPTWHALVIIPLMIVQFTFFMGIGLFLGATTVFIRDITQVLSTVIMLLMFFTPLFYTIEMLPKIIQKVTFFNPLYQICEPYRAVLLYHRLPDFTGFAYLAVLAVILNVVGLKYFRKLKGYFEMKM